MIKEKLTRLVKTLAGQCQHPEEEQARAEYAVCGTCGMVLVLEAASVNTPVYHCPAATQHNDAKSGEALKFKYLNRIVCLTCGETVRPLTAYFRSYVRLRKHIRHRTGIPTNRKGERLSKTPTFNVGLRYVIAEYPNAVKRVWVTFEDKKSAKEFAHQIERRMLFCTDDDGYNAVINDAIAIIRDENPEVTEEVVENDNGGAEDNEV